MAKLFLVFILLCPVAAAQMINIGVIVSLTGEHAQQGLAYGQAIPLFEAELAASKAYLTSALKISLKDDQSDPELTQKLALDLYSEGAQVIICCQNQEASQAVLESLAGSIPLFLLSEETQALRHVYSFKQSLQEQFRAIFLRLAALNQTKLAVMTPETVLADEVEQTVRALSVPGGIQIIELNRYGLTEALTPDALWVATRLPDAILLWDDDVERTISAYQALRDRGFEKNVYINPSVFERLTDKSQLRAAFTLVPAIFDNRLDSQHPSFAQIASYRNAYEERYGVTDYGGYELFDALTIISLASEQTLSYGITEASALRSALQESLETLGQLSGLMGQLNMAYPSEILSSEAMRFIQIE